jgi:hypothetical protein
MQSQVISSRFEHLIASIVFFALILSALFGCFQAAHFFGFADGLPLFLFAGAIASVSVIDAIRTNSNGPFVLGVIVLAVTSRLADMTFIVSAVVSGLTSTAVLFAIGFSATFLWERFRSQKGKN